VCSFLSFVLFAFAFWSIFLFCLSLPLLFLFSQDKLKQAQKRADDLRGLALNNIGLFLLSLPSFVISFVLCVVYIACQIFSSLFFGFVADLALSRGEQLEDLQNKAENLESQSKQFQKGSTQLKQKMCWENYRNLLIIIAIICVRASFCLAVLSMCSFLLAFLLPSFLPSFLSSFPFLSFQIIGLIIGLVAGLV
jgi:hypothetical protein